MAIQQRASDSGPARFVDLRDDTGTDDLQKRADFDIIRYANCWEDAGVVRRALQVGEGDRVLSIASSGDNALELLATGAEVVAVDLSLPQLACLDLRVAAFQSLAYDGVLGFLGVEPSRRRRETYRRLRDQLAEPTRRFWDAHPDQIADGVIFGGKFEEYFGVFRRWVLPLVHSREIVERLLEEKFADERHEFYDEVWDSWRWRLLFRFFFSEWVMGRLGRDPEFFRYVDGPVSAEILERTERALTELPTHDNPYLEFILRGNFEQTVPPYLQRDKFEAIREGLDRLTLCRGTVEEAARQWETEGFDGYNLSDIFEYLDESTSREIYGTLIEAANPGARLATWNMMVPRAGHEWHPDRLEALTDQSRRLHRQARAFFYGDFVVEEVQP